VHHLRHGCNTTQPRSTSHAWHADPRLAREPRPACASSSSAASQSRLAMATCALPLSALATSSAACAGGSSAAQICARARTR